MWGKKYEQPKKRSSFLPFVILRVCLSLVMLSIFVVALYQAFRYFSGMNPIRMDPKTIAVSFLTSESTVHTISDLLGFKVDTGSLQKVVGNGGSEAGQSGTPTPVAKQILKFALVADSHNDTDDLTKALAQAKKNGAKFVIGLGDYTNTGTPEELQATKDVFAASGLPYYLTPGDHDMWNARDKNLSSATADFSQIFGTPYQSFSDSGVYFVILSDADNYIGVDPVQMSWFSDALSASKKYGLVLAFMHEPLYHPSSDHGIGKTNPDLKKQAEQITRMLKDNNVAEVFFGDVHAFTRYSEPVTGLKMTTVGAVTRTQNTQTPRFVEVNVFADNSYSVADTEIQ